MGKQTFDKIKKTVAILLAIFFVATLTVTLVSAKTEYISIEGFAFKPSSIDVSKGDLVSWTNKDNVDHTVTSVSGPFTFDSGHIQPGQSYEFRFTQLGDVDYECSIHPTMRGTVKVV
jgi:plastocyanin